MAHRRIRLKQMLRTDNLEAEYALETFTDALVAIPAGAVDILSLPSMGVTRAQDKSLNGLKPKGGKAAIIWRVKAGPVQLHGPRQAEAATEHGSG
jgi:hypothetical protein